MGAHGGSDEAQGVAIVGMACRFPDAADVASFWENLCGARKSFRDIPADRWNHALFQSDVAREVDKTYVRRGAFIDGVADFAALHFGIAPRRVAVMDPQHRLLLEAVRVALLDAGLENADFDRSQMGTFLGVSSSEYRTLLSARTLAVQMASGALGESSPQLAQAIADSVKAVEPISAFSIPGMLLNMTAANVAHRWKLGGPAYTIDAACASALVAVHDAVMYLRAGTCDSALAGGVYLNLTPDNLIGFARASAVSRSGECRPFDAASDGFLQGEGAAVVVLKRLDAAVRDGDRIYAVIRGIGINNDGGTSDGPMAPSLSGQVDCLRRAYGDAGVAPSTVGMVECHGTATKVGDPIEVAALRQMMAEGAEPPSERIWLSSVKANIGHTMSTAGVAGLMRATLALHHELIPPQAGFSAPNPLLHLEDGPFDVPRQAVPWPRREGRPRRAGVSSFGFGGTNCHLVVEEAPVDRRGVPSPALEQGGSELFVLGAESRELLARHALEIAAALEGLPGVCLGDVAYTLTATRQHDRFKLAVVASAQEELLSGLRAGAARLAGSEPLSLKLGPSIFVTPGDSEKPPRIAFMFPGQGAQRVGLLRWMFDRFESFREGLRSLEKSLDGVLERPLLSSLYPDAENGDLQAAEERLQATQVCQPVMAALGLALAQFMRELGVEPAVCIGHSVGEFVAAGVSGILTPEAALRFTAERGRLMAALALPDPGAMAAVRADPATVGKFLRPGVCIANCNHPQQTVISGATAAVEAAMAALVEAGIGAKRLRVSHAFHSEMMTGVGRDLAQRVEALELRAAKVPLVSAITGEPYPDDPERLGEARTTFVRHATSPVDFVKGLERCLGLGADFFLEVGAGTTLSTFVAASLGHRPRGSGTLAATEDDRGRELFRTLAMLAVLGQPIDFNKVYPRAGRRVVSLPAAPLAAERYWATRTSGAVAVVAPALATRSAPGGAGPSPEANVSDEMIKLFREQTAVLAQHAEIIARQTAMITGQAVKPIDPAAAALPASPPSAPTRGPEPVLQAPAKAAAAPVAESSVLDKVLDAVSKVSAFPKASLKASQSLVTELGLDSLMLMELVSAIQAAFPGAAEIPQSLLNQKTTIAELVAHMERGGATAQVAVADAPSVDAPRPKVQRFRPAFVPRGRSAFRAEPMPADAWLLLTANGSVAAATLERLVNAGQRVVAVEAGTFSGVEKDAPGLLRLQWPLEADQIPGLFAQLARADASPAGVLHMAAMGLAAPVAQLLTSGAADWPNPIPVAQQLAAGLYQATGGKPLAFAVVTGLGGHLGMGEPGPTVWQASLAGFTKALSREWDARVKVIDVDPSQPSPTVAAQIVGELVAADRDVEVAFAGGKRQVIGLELAPHDGAKKALLDERSVVMVTGGGRGIGARVALDLASSHRCGLLIVGSRERVPGGELDGNLAAMRKAGARVEYVRWDIRRDEIPEDLAKARASLGPVTGLLHCAGVIHDKRVAEKNLRDVREVMDVKVAGLLNALRATEKDPLSFVISFSSWSGRFGNAGQTDYAAANELLNRLVAGLSSWRPGVVATSVAWPPWESSGMAQSIPGPVRAAMRKEGVPFLTDEEGLAAFRQELADRVGGEVLIATGEPPVRRELCAWQRLSLETHPFLGDHRIKDVPVLPMASALDLFAALAREQAGEGPLEILDLELFNGVEVKGPVSLVTELRRKGTGPLQLEARADGRVAYRAQARIGQGSPEGLEMPAGGVGPSRPLPMTLEAFYRDVAFHGSLLRGIERVEELGPRQISGWVRTSRPSDWIKTADRAAWAVDPLVVDSSFQLVLYWLWAHHEKAALPVGFRRFVQVAPFGDGPIRCRLLLGEASGDALVGSIQYEDERGRLLAVMVDARAKILDPVRRAAATGKNGNGTAAKADDGGEIDERHYRIERFEAVEALYERLGAAATLGLRNPYFNVNDGVARDTSIVNGQEMINFSTYNYLGLSGHPSVSAAAKAAVDRYGTSVSASRVASGEKPLHGELERALAELLGCQACIVFSAGHATNETVIGFMFGDGDLILHDALAHNSIQQGATLSGAKRRPFPHNDWQALDKLLTQLRPHYKKVLVAVEGVYSMDGDIPDLPRFVELREKHRFLLFVDEAHSAGVLGATGRGIGEHFKIRRTDVDVWMGTLSKSFASCGGYIAGSQALVDFIKYGAPGFVFSAGLSPANAGAAKAAIAELRAHPELVQQLHERSRLFLELAKERGLDTGMSDGSAVIPCIVGNSLISLQLSQRLAERGINVQPIVYPAVEEDGARLRFFLSATHSEAQIRKTVDIVAQELAALRAPAEESPQDAAP